MFNPTTAELSRWRTPAYAPERKSGAGLGKGAAKDSPLILVVDDDLDSCVALQTLLKMEGFEVVTAASGAQALELCGKRRPDLAVVDVSMPGMTGLELCSLLRNGVACADVPIVIYSAYVINPYSNTGLYDAAFLKPADPEHLLDRIRVLLGITRPSR